MRRPVVAGAALFVLVFALGLWLWPSPAPPRVEPEVRAARKARAAKATRPKSTFVDDVSAAGPLPDDPHERADVVADSVFCGVEGLLEGERGYWVYGAGVWARRGAAVVKGGELMLVGAGADWAGELQVHLPSWAPVAARLEHGLCSPRPLPLARPARRLFGRVVDIGEAGDRVRVRCGAASVWVSADGSYSLELGPEACVAEAIRRDGALFARGSAVHIDANRLGDIPLDLSLPEGVQSGLGLAIRSTERGIRVAQVHEGVAGAAGITRRSVILEVDGVETAGMSAEDFIELATGEEEAPVELLVEDPSGEVKRYTLARAPVPSPYDED